jgi:HAD superfamily hydrolase (TIGR01509 family)
MSQWNGRAVLWDLDGVLADTGQYHYESWEQILPKYGIPFTQDKLRRTFGMNNHGVITSLVGRDLERSYTDEIADRKETLFRDLIRGRIQPLPGVRAWLPRLRALGYRVAVASSAPQANIDAMMDQLGILPYFDAVVSSAGMPSKPDPAVFLLAAERVSAPPDRCTVVEDAIAGVEAAKQAGMRCIAVTSTNPREALSRADLVVDSLEDLKDSDF